MLPRVIVYQTEKKSAQGCLEALFSTGITETDPHCSVTCWLGDAGRLVSELYGGEKQLLIVDSFNGNRDAAEKFVGLMTQKNPQLTVALFSAGGIHVRNCHYVLATAGPEGYYGQFLVTVHGFLHMRELEVIAREARAS